MNHASQPSHVAPPQADYRATVETIWRSLPREVWIVTAQAEEHRGGLLATWVHAASLDPLRPVVMAGLGNDHHTTQLVLKSRSFALHLLRPDQTELAWSFARDSGRERDKLAGLRASASPLGNPWLDDCLCQLDCRVERCVETPDRRYFWAVVVAARGQAGPALTADVFFRSLTATQQQPLFESLERDIERERTHYVHSESAAG